MKCVILAGGKGTRIAEESVTRPKPMLEIGSRPILWHIMKLYAAFGVARILAADGYAARQAALECAVGQRGGAVETLAGVGTRWPGR
jgi:NDP-sugar pyrophosphorylase family protein